MCPIAAPLLWRTAEALLAAGSRPGKAQSWLQAAAEVEFLCDGPGEQVAVQLLCTGSVPQLAAGLEEVAQELRTAGVPLISLGASRWHAASGRTMETLAIWGAGGLRYTVGEENFWLRPGSFFQVSRFLVPTMAALVRGDRRGARAWDLYAGVGLFARALAEGFSQVVAVEANPGAQDELRRGLGLSSRGKAPQVHRAETETTLDFLRREVLQRERPDLVVMDPPRAGLGEEVCSLLRRTRPAQMVYVSCDPTTLARDVALLLQDGLYRVADLYMLDLFPQTYHLETVMVLDRVAVGG